jgi:hypothetical protein
MRLARALAVTSFVPKAFRGKPEECAAAILTGHELGFPPTGALRAFYPAPDGRMEMYARAMQAVALSHGHRIWVAKQTEDEVIVRGHRKGTSSDEIQEVKWDQARVKKAKLLKEDGNHAKFPQQMMAARGIAEMARLVAPDALHGIYAIEERDDSPIHVEATVGAPTPVTAADILADSWAGTPDDTEPATVEQPAAVDKPVEGPGPERPVVDIGDAPAAITTAQSKKIYALLQKIGKADKDLALVYIAGVVGRELESTKDLTVAEASALNQEADAAAVALGDDGYAKLFPDSKKGERLTWKKYREHTFSTRNVKLSAGSIIE